MSRDRGASVSTTLFCLALMVAACREGSIAPGEVALSSIPIVAPDASLDRQLGPLEQRFKEIEDAAAGFAGFYLDAPTGDLVMRLKDMSKGDIVRPFAEAEAGLRPMNDGTRRGIRYESAEFSFSELRGFRGAMFRHLHREEVVYVDIDEYRNRLRIGVTSEAARSELLAIAANSDIPGSGIDVGVTIRNSVDRLDLASFPPGGFSGSLSSHQDTIIGGLLIRVDTHGCSAWIPAKSGSTKVFATASHCDADGYADLDTGVVFAHHSVFHDAGTEWKDPAYVSGCDGMPTPCTSRWSDAALYKVIADSSTKHSRGWFANTTNHTGSTTLHDSIPVYGADSEQSYPVTNQEIHRVGYATGWREGTVSATAVDQHNWNNHGVGSWLLDQDEAVMPREEGDSGAPMIVPNGSSLWKIAGMHVGGRADTTVFSAMWNIEQDLGALTTLALPRLE